MDFNSDGALKIGDSAARGGSKGARDLLNKSFSGNRVILFEDASSRKDVVFCRVVLGKLDPMPAADVYVVLIDFADFRQVSGDKLVDLGRRCWGGLTSGAESARGVALQPLGKTHK